MASLYELTSDLKELQEIDFCEAEAEQIEQIKDIIKTQIETKGTGIIAVIRNEESDIDSIKAEIKRLQEIVLIFIGSCCLRCFDALTEESKSDQRLKELMDLEIIICIILVSLVISFRFVHIMFQDMWL